MNIIKAKYKAVWYAVAVMFLAVSFQAPAMADIVTTDQVLAESQADAKRAELSSLLDRSDVKQQLVNMGVDVDDAQKRIDSMTDSELAAVYDQMDVLPAGQDILGVVLGLIVNFMLLDLAGVTDVFPGI